MPPELPQNNNEVELEAILLETQNQGEVLDDIRVTNEAQVLEATKGNEELRELNSTVDMIAEKVINTKPQRVAIEINGGKETIIEGPQGEKGDKGDMPTKGVDYFTPQEIQDIVNQVQARVKDGKDGKDGADAVVDYEAIIRDVVPLIPKGKDGKDALVDYESIIEEVLAQIPDPKDGKDGKSVSIDEVVSKLKKEDVFGEMEKRVNEAHERVNKLSSKTVSLSELDDVDLTGVTQTNGKYVLGSGGGSGAVDSVNGQTGVVVLDADDIDDTSTTHKFVTTSDVTKLSNLSGANTGDVTLAGTPDYITITGQVITRNQIDLTTDVTGDLPLSNIAQVSTSRIMGRSTAGTGDIEALTASSARTVLGLSTSDSPEFTSVNIGHATDTTLSRVSAGVIAVEGVTIPTISSTSTLTNKRTQPRTSSSTSSSTLTPDLSSANVYFRTTQTTGLTINAPTGTPVIGEVIVIYVDSAGSQTLTMNATYIPFGTAFPATTTAGKTLMLTAQFNGANWKTCWSEAV
jgi:hypothetical protein